MMGIREAHPDEPVLARLHGIEEVDRAVGDPIGVVVLPFDGIVLQLNSAGIPTPARRHRDLLGGIVSKQEVSVAFLGMVVLETFGIVHKVPSGASRMEQTLDAFEAAVGTGISLRCGRILPKFARQDRIEMCLA